MLPKSHRVSGQTRLLTTLRRSSVGTVVIHLILAELTVLITALAETHVTEAIRRGTRVTIASVDTSKEVGADRVATAAAGSCGGVQRRVPTTGRNTIRFGIVVTPVDGQTSITRVLIGTTVRIASALGPITTRVLRLAASGRKRKRIASPEMRHGEARSAHTGITNKVPDRVKSTARRRRSPLVNGSNLSRRTCLISPYAWITQNFAQHLRVRTPRRSSQAWSNVKRAFETCPKRVRRMGKTCPAKSGQTLPKASRLSIMKAFVQRAGMSSACSVKYGIRTEEVGLRSLPRRIRS